jgi:ferredoxin like protein
MGVPGSVPERLAANRYRLDEGESHIEVDQALARATGSGSLLVRVCPAHVYSEAADGTIVVQHAACLECGACLALAPPGVLRWHYPRGGFGIAYREG